MGTDLYCIAETLIDGEWVGICECGGRNYLAFAEMADVRNEEGIQPRFTPRGIPENASKLSQLLSSNARSPGHHSHSWLMAEELFPILHDLYKRLEARAAGPDNDPPGYHARALDSFEKTWFGHHQVIIAFRNWHSRLLGRADLGAESLLNLQALRFVFWFDD
jgi:hypothetical protein